MSIRYESLINGHTEGIDTGILQGEGTGDIFYKMIERQPGVYVLYNGKKVYYVGRSTTSASRIDQHFRDRLANKWDNFSFYRLAHKKYLQDLEVLLIHSTKSKQGKKRGAVRGNFVRSKNLTKEFRRNFKARRKEEEEPLFENLEKLRKQYSKIKSSYDLLYTRKARQYRIKINKRKRRGGSRVKIRLTELREERRRKLDIIDSMYKMKVKPVREDMDKIKRRLDENKTRAKRVRNLT